MNEPIQRDYQFIQSQLSQKNSFQCQNSRVSLSGFKNEFSLSYPCQPKDQGSQEISVGDNLDSRDYYQIESITSRSKSNQLKKMIVLPDKQKLTSPSIKRKRAQIIKQLRDKFIKKIRISDNGYIKNQFVNQLLQINIPQQVKQIQLSEPIQKVNKFTQFCKSQFQYPFNRNSTIRAIGKNLMQIVYITITLFTPLIIIFPDISTLLVFLYIQFICIIINNICNMFTVYYDNDIEIKTIKKIQIHYLKKHGFYDFFVYISFSTILSLKDEILNTICIILLNLIIMKYIKLKFITSDKSLLQIIRRFTTIILYCHIFTIIQISIDYKYVINEELYNQTNVYLQLMLNFIHEFLAITSSIENTTCLQILFSIIVCIIFTCCKLKLFFEILFYFNQKIDYYLVKKNYFELKSYLSDHKVSNQLIQQALSNYKFEMKNDILQSSFMEDMEQIKYVNIDIQKQIDKVVKKKYFKYIKNLSQFSINIQEQLIEAMQFKFYAPNSLILSTQQKDEQAVYLIKKGQVRVCFKTEKDGQIIIKRLIENQVFGEISFFTGLPRQCEIFSYGPVQLYKIERNDFLNIIKQNRQDLEIANFIHDEIIYNSNYAQIGLRCFCCNSCYHLITSCPQLHYIPNKEKVLSKSQFHHKQQRQQSNYLIIFTSEQRFRKKSSNTLAYQSEAEFACQEYRENNFIDQEEEELGDFLLQDLENNNVFSSTNLQSQIPSQMHYQNRDRGISIDKNNSFLSEIKDDIKENQYHDLDQMIGRKDIQSRIINSNQTLSVPREIIEEQDSESSSSNSEKDNAKQNQSQKNKPIYLIQPFKQSYGDYTHSMSQQQLNQANNDILTPQRQNRKSQSYACSQLIMQDDNKTKQSEQQRHSFLIPQHPIPSNIIFDELSKGNQDNEFRQKQNQRKKKQQSVTSNSLQTQWKCDEPTNQFQIITIDNKYFSCMEDDHFDKAQNFTFYYPYFNPDFIINKYNNHKRLFIHEKQKRNSYTINYIISEKIYQIILESL